MSSRRAHPGDLVGRDFARVHQASRPSRARALGWLLITGFACALAIAALRIDILRLRYALGEAVSREKQLVQEQRQNTAQLETLRDPSRLAELAHELGFSRPDRVVRLDSSSAEAPTP
jgi:AraC-like DNA-binding protein